MSMIKRNRGRFFEFPTSTSYYCIYYLPNEDDSGYGAEYYKAYGNNHIEIDNTGHTFILYSNYKNNYYGHETQDYGLRLCRLYNRQLSEYPSTITTTLSCLISSCLYHDKTSNSLYVYYIPEFEYDNTTEYYYDSSTLFCTGCSIDEYNNAVPMFTVPIMYSLDSNNVPNIYATKSGTMAWVMVVASVDEARKGASWGKTMLTMFAHSGDYTTWETGDTLKALTINTFDAMGEGFIFTSDFNSSDGIMLLHYPRVDNSWYVGTTFENNGSFVLFQVDTDFNFTKSTISWKHSDQGTLTDGGFLSSELDWCTVNNTLHAIWHKYSTINTDNVILYSKYDGTTWFEPNTITTYYQSIDIYYTYYSSINAHFTSAYSNYNALCYHTIGNTIHVFRSLYSLDYIGTFTLQYRLLSDSRSNMNTLSWSDTIIHENPNTLDYGELTALPPQTYREGVMNGDQYVSGGSYQLMMATPCHTVNTSEPDTFHDYAHYTIASTLAVDYNMSENITKQFVPTYRVGNETINKTFDLLYDIKLLSVDKTFTTMYSIAPSGWQNTIYWQVQEQAGGTYDYYPATINVPYMEGMNSDFSDVRWLDNYGDTIEFGILEKVDENFCIFVLLTSFPSGWSYNYFRMIYNNPTETSSTAIDYTSWIENWYAFHSDGLVSLDPTTDVCSDYSTTVALMAIPSWAYVYSAIALTGGGAFSATYGRVKINGTEVSWGSECGSAYSNVGDLWGYKFMSDNQETYEPLYIRDGETSNTLEIGHYDESYCGFMIAYIPTASPSASTYSP